MELITISIAILLVAIALFLFLSIGFMMGIQNESQISSKYYEEAEKYKNEIKSKDEKIDFLEKANEELSEEIKQLKKQYEKIYIDLDAMKAKNISRYAHIGV